MEWTYVHKQHQLAYKIQFLQITVIKKVILDSGNNVCSSAKKKIYYNIDYSIQICLYKG